jgi:Trk-type K+ transport system membrane component
MMESLGNVKFPILYQLMNQETKKFPRFSAKKTPCRETKIKKFFRVTLKISKILKIYLTETLTHKDF